MTELKEDKRLTRNKEKYIGMISSNNQGCLMKIIEYRRTDDMDVQFLDEFGYIYRHATRQNFVKGNIRNPFYPTIFGVGYLGDINENNKDVFYDKMYRTWRLMLSRCYDKNDRAYIWYGKKGIIVCDEWHCFSNFYEWAKENYYEVDSQKMNLDKDILSNGRKKIYSPSNCIFVPKYINTLFTFDKSNKGEYPTGVSFHKNKNGTILYSSHLSSNSKRNTKYFKTVKEAQNDYKRRKEIEIKRVADLYKDKIPKKLYDALYSYKIQTEEN